MVQVDGAGKTNSQIQVRGLDKTYRRGGEEIHVLQGLNLDVEKGDFVAFMGPSGSGKTTLLNLLGGLDVPTRGSITVAGDEITNMSANRVTQLGARPVGFFFYMSDVQPDSRAHPFSDRGASAAADQAFESRAARARGDGARRRRPV